MSLLPWVRYLNTSATATVTGRVPTVSIVAEHHREGIPATDITRTASLVILLANRVWIRSTTVWTTLTDTPIRDLYESPKLLLRMRARVGSNQRSAPIPIYPNIEAAQPEGVGGQVSSAARSLRTLPYPTEYLLKA